MQIRAKASGGGNRVDRAELGDLRAGGAQATAPFVKEGITT